MINHLLSQYSISQFVAEAFNTELKTQTEIYNLFSQIKNELEDRAINHEKRMVSGITIYLFITVTIIVQNFILRLLPLLQLLLIITLYLTVVLLVIVE